MADSNSFRTTVCPACGTSFKYRYQAGQMLYRMQCRKAACATSFTVDITPYVQHKTVVLRGGEHSETVLELPEELTGTLEV